MQLVIVSGLSGAGKSVALRQFEDRSWYCIDNLPLDLVQPLVAHALAHPEPRFQRIALGIDARANPREIEDFPRTVDTLRSLGVGTRVLFLHAADEVILRRYAETRRKHPLVDAELSLADAIAHERRLLKPVGDLADETLDTSILNLHELRAALQARMPEAGEVGMALTLLSFGFKNGTPEGVDFIFDARCLPNPHWVPTLRSMTGRDADVAAYLQVQPEVAAYADALEAFLRRWLPAFAAQDRPYITVAVGCTGGQHRSVYLVERLGPRLRDTAATVTLKHREIG